MTSTVTILNLREANLDSQAHDKVIKVLEKSLDETTAPIFLLCGIHAALCSYLMFLVYLPRILEHKQDE